jgi:hypothetical protein
MMCTGSAREGEGTGEHVQEQEPNVRAVEPLPGLEPSQQQRSAPSHLEGPAKGRWVAHQEEKRMCPIWTYLRLGTPLLVVSWALQIYL